MSRTSPTATAARTVALATVRRLATTGEARRIRLSAGVSLSEIADAVGTSTSSLHRWETGRRAPHGDPAVAYLDLLHDLQRAIGADQNGGDSS